MKISIDGGTIFLITFVLVVLKLSGAITCYWWIVMSPIIFGAIVFLLIIVAAFLMFDKRGL